VDEAFGTVTDVVAVVVGIVVSVEATEVCPEGLADSDSPPPHPTRRRGMRRLAILARITR
jgi:hypothetical protein